MRVSSFATVLANSIKRVTAVVTSYMAANVPISIAAFAAVPAHVAQLSSSQDTIAASFTLARSMFVCAQRWTFGPR